MKKSKKTLWAGILTIAVALGNVAISIATGHPIDPGSTITGLITGAGLVVAKDWNVSGNGTNETK